MLIDNLSDLLVFTEIVKLGSLSAAGKKLGLSSAVVSKRLQRLESQLNTLLITRSTRNLSVTEEGHRYYQHCLYILDAVEASEAEILYKNDVPKGTLKVSAPAFFGRLYIAPLMPTFLQQYPEIDLSLNFSDQFVDIISSGYDLAIRIGELQDSNLIIRKLAVDQRVVVASPEYIKRCGKPIVPKDLGEHNVLIFANPSPLNIWTFQDAEQNQQSIKVSGNFETNNCETLNQSTMAGLGIALRPRWDVWRFIESGELVPLLEEYLAPRFDIQAVYPSRTHLPHRVRVFIDMLKQDLEQQSTWNY